MEHKILILNKTRHWRDRYTLITDSSGGYGEPAHYPSNKYQIAYGEDVGNGYQGRSSITYFLLKDEFIPDEAKNTLIDWLVENGYRDYLVEMGVLLPE